MKINNTLVIVFLVLLLPFNLYPQKKDFKVFNALLFKDTPDLTEYGFSKINMIYEDGVITTNSKYKRGDFEWRYIDRRKVLRESNRSKLDSNIPTVLDVEYWGSRLNRASTKRRAEDTFVQLLNEYRENDRESLVSVFHYGVFSEPILKASNVVYPCFYTHSEDRKEWLNMVKYHLNRLKKMNTENVPVYVFIWPQYNPVPGRHNLGYKFVDSDFWRFQLETLYKLCDGVVIWSHYRDENNRQIYFDENMPWFKETLKFIEEHNIKQQ